MQGCGVVRPQSHRERETACLYQEPFLDLLIQAGVVGDAHDEGSARPDHADGFGQDLTPVGHQVQYVPDERAPERTITEREPRRVRHGEAHRRARRRLRDRAVQHRRREVDPVDADTALRQRDREHPRADPDFEHTARRNELAGEHVDRGRECIRRQRLRLVIEVGGGVERDRREHIVVEIRKPFSHRATVPASGQP
jgi:hypothetical protein